MSDLKSDLAVWLEFIKALFWPATVLIGLFVFRTQLKSLLDRISSFKVGDTEMAFQSPSPDASMTTPVKAADVVGSGVSQRLTESGIRDAVRETGQLTAGEEPYRSMQIFSTSSQTTWLVFSKSKIFCALDDAATRKSGRIVQWALPTEKADPISAREKRAGVGLIDIGERRNWLYSTSLFSSPDLIEAEVRRAVAEAANQS
jgi:hypothetical protein